MAIVTQVTPTQLCVECTTYKKESTIACTVQFLLIMRTSSANRITMLGLLDCNLALLTHAHTQQKTAAQPLSDMSDHGQTFISFSCKASY